MASVAGPCGWLLGQPVLAPRRGPTCAAGAGAAELLLCLRRPRMDVNPFRNEFYAAEVGYA